MCKILIPIHPKYVEGIVQGNKLFELRRRIPKRKVDKLVIYSTSPVMKVICEVTVSNITTDNVDNVWELVKNHSMVSYSEFYNYFNKNGDIANAFHISDVKVYDEPLDLIDIGVKYTPQSFVYLN